MAIFTARQTASTSVKFAIQELKQLIATRHRASLDVLALPLEIQSDSLVVVDLSSEAESPATDLIEEANVHEESIRESNLESPMSASVFGVENSG